jgi:hypothetical protein
MNAAELLEQLAHASVTWPDSEMVSACDTQLHAAIGVLNLALHKEGLHISHLNVASENNPAGRRCCLTLYRRKLV